MRPANLVLPDKKQFSAIPRRSLSISSKSSVRETSDSLMLATSLQSRRDMSDVASSDRRRVPRALIADTELSVLAFPIPVRLLDISLGGVLLESTHPVEL